MSKQLLELLLLGDLPTRLARSITLTCLDLILSSLLPLSLSVS